MVCREAGVKGWTSLVLPVWKTSVRRLWELISRNSSSLSPFLLLVRVSPMQSRAWETSESAAGCLRPGDSSGLTDPLQMAQQKEK